MPNKIKLKMIQNQITYLQFLAKQYLKVGKVAEAFECLFEDLGERRFVLPATWKTLADKSVAMGLLPELEKAYKLLKQPVPLTKYLQCGRAAIKKRTAKEALAAFRKAKLSHLPKNQLKNLAEKEFAEGSLSAADYVQFCADVKAKSDSFAMAARLAKARAEFKLADIDVLAKKLKQSVSRQCMLDCYENSRKTFDLVGLELAARMLGMKIRKGEYLSIGKEAFKAGKFAEGSLFFKKVYPEN